MHGGAMTARSVSRAYGIGVGLVLLILVACSRGAASPTPNPAMAPMTGATLATALPSSARNLDKVDLVFMQLLAVYQTQGLDAATQFARAQGILTTKDEVRVTLVLDSDDQAVVDGTALSIERLGGRVTQTYDNQIELVVPVKTAMEYGKQANKQAFFNDLSDFSHVKDIRRTPIAQQM